jgi:hypothetical protein
MREDDRPKGGLCTESLQQNHSGPRKSSRVRKIVKYNTSVKKAVKLVNEKSKLCSKLSINWRSFRKSSNRSLMLSNKTISTQQISSRIERVVPLEAQFIDHTNYTGKYRNMRPRYYIKVSKSAVHGFGLFAIRAIPKETFLIEYVGNQKIIW